MSDEICSACDGYGKLTWYYGMNTYNYEQCDKCSGSGVIRERYVPPKTYAEYLEQQEARRKAKLLEQQEAKRKAEL